MISKTKSVSDFVQGLKQTPSKLRLYQPNNLRQSYTNLPGMFCYPKGELTKDGIVETDDGSSGKK